MFAYLVVCRCGCVLGLGLTTTTLLIVLIDAQAAEIFKTQSLHIMYFHDYDHCLRESIWFLMESIDWPYGSYLFEIKSNENGGQFWIYANCS